MIIGKNDQNLEYGGPAGIYSIWNIFCYNYCDATK